MSVKPAREKSRASREDRFDTRFRPKMVVLRKAKSTPKSLPLADRGDEHGVAAESTPADALDSQVNAEQAGNMEAGNMEAGSQPDDVGASSAPRSMEEVEEVAKETDGSLVVVATPSAALEGQNTQAGQVGQAGKRCMTSSQILARFDREMEAEKGGALAARLQQEEDEIAAKTPHEKTVASAKPKQTGSALKSLPAPLKSLIHCDDDDAEEVVEEKKDASYNPFKNKNEGQLSAARKDVLKEIAKYKDQLLVEKNPLAILEQTRKLTQADDELVPLANAMTEVLGAVHPHADFMQDYSKNVKGLGDFLEKLADYYHATPAKIAKKVEELAQIEMVIREKNAARIRRTMLKDEDRLRKQEADAEAEGKQRKRARASVGSQFDDSEWVAVTQGAQDFFDEHEEDFTANGIMKITDINPQHFGINKLTKKVVELKYMALEISGDDE